MRCFMQLYACLEELRKIELHASFCSVFVLVVHV